MNVIIDILGREAIPVRAIPFVTGWKIDPQELVRNFANSAYLTRVDVVAYSLNENVNLSKILPKEWDGVDVKLKALESRVRRKNNNDDEGYEEWRRESIALLPSGCFVWKDEFSEGHKRNLGIALKNERSGDRENNFSPLVPAELKELIFEGFDANKANQTIQQIKDYQNSTPTYETSLLKILNLAVKEFCEPRKNPDPKKNEVTDWLISKGNELKITVTKNIAEAIFTIIKPADHNPKIKRVEPQD